MRALWVVTEESLWGYGSQCSLPWEAEEWLWDAGGLPWAKPWRCELAWDPAHQPILEAA